MPLKLRKHNDIYYARGYVPYRKADGTVAQRRIERSLATRDHKRALTAARDIEREYWDQAYSDTPAGGTFAEAALLYMQTKGVTTHIKPLLAYFATTPLKEINQTAMNRAAREIYKDRAPATINRQLFTPVIAIMNFASKQGLCTPPNFDRPKGHNKQTPVQVPDENWFTAVLPHCRPQLRALIIFLTLTGRRLGEALAIKPDDVDLIEGRALIRQTKINEPFVAELARPVVEAIAEIEDWEDAPIVFRYCNRSNAYRDLKAACRAAGVPYFSPHVFGRHKFATRLLEAGYSLQFVKDAGHWKTIRMVAERYGHLEKREVASAVRAVGDKWGAEPAAKSKFRVVG